MLSQGGQIRSFFSICLPWKTHYIISSLSCGTQSWPQTSQFSISSVQLSCSVVSDSLQSHRLQHPRPLCPLPTPRIYSNSCPLSQWCHPTISSSVIPFSSHLKSFPESGSFSVIQFFVSGGQSTGVSASASVLPMKYSGLIFFRMDWLDILAVQGTLKSLLQHHSSKPSIFCAQLSSQSNFHIHTWPLEKP